MIYLALLPLFLMFLTSYIRNRSKRELRLSFPPFYSIEFFTYTVLYILGYSVMKPSQSEKQGT